VSEDVKADVNDRPVGHAPGHARHDRLLIVRYAAGDLEGTDLEQATSQANECAECARLASDAKSLQASLSAMPAPKRTRDFRLTPERAEQLRGSALDRFLRRLAMPKLGLLRPVAGVGVALGLTIAAVGGGMPAAYLGAGGTAAPIANDMAATPSDREAGAAANAAPSYTVAGGDTSVQFATASAAPVLAPASSAKANSSVESLTTSAPPTATQAIAVVPSAAPPTNENASVAPAATNTSGDPGRLLIVYAGLTLAIVAFGLLLLSLYARRRNEDPLLR